MVGEISLVAGFGGVFVFEIYRRSFESQFREITSKGSHICRFVIEGAIYGLLRDRS